MNRLPSRVALMLAGLLGLLPLAARSADPVAGGTTFNGICAACHTLASTAVVDRGSNSPAKISAAIAEIPEMGFLASTLSAASRENVAAFLGNTPATLSFTQTTVGATSAASVVTVRASDFAALSNMSASVSGDFVLQGGTCGTSLPESGSCTVGVAFRPTAAGARSGTLSLVNSGLTTPVAIVLSGAGAAAPQPTLSLGASSIAFGSQVVATPSIVRSVTVSNTGSAALNFTAIALSGANAADFALGGTCAVATAVAAGGTCTVTATFTPAATGSRAATVTLSSNASNGSATLALAGTGIAAGAPAVTLGATSLDFGNVAVGTSSGAKTVSLTNSGSAALVIQGIAATAPFATTSDCGSSLAAGASCTISVTFAPGAAVAASGSLTLTTNAAGSPQAVALTGTGVTIATGTLQWSAAGPVDFGTVDVGAEAATQTLTLSNTGSGTADVGTIAIAGANAADFRVDSTSTCGAASTLAAGASCEVVLGFAPGVAGARTATLGVTSDNANTPGALALTGTGSAPPAPGLTLSQTSLSITAVSGEIGIVGRLTLTNSGNADLHVSAIAIDNPRFLLSTPDAGACGVAPFTLSSGASCEVDVSWAGTDGSPPDSGTLTITGDMQPATATVALSASNAAVSPANEGGGGCTLAANTRAVDPVLSLMAVIAAGVLWRRRRRQP